MADTPEDAAREVAGRILAEARAKYGDIAFWPTATAQITAALLSFRRAGRAEGLEEAAKVAERCGDKVLHVYSRGPTSPPGNQMVPVTGAIVASAIRALADSTKEGG